MGDQTAYYVGSFFLPSVSLGAGQKERKRLFFGGGFHHGLSINQSIFFIKFILRVIFTFILRRVSVFRPFCESKPNT